MSFEDFLRWNNISLVFTNIPCKIHGFAYYNGIEYLVVINAKNSYQQSQKTLIHELIHIFENHFSCDRDHEHECEMKVDQILKNLKYNFI